MDPNPYESPKCDGYRPPAKPVSKARDFVALICWGLAINVIAQVIGFCVGVASGYIKLFD